MRPVCNMHQLVERHTAAVNFLHIVPHGVTVDDVLAPSYWANAWKRFEGKERSTVDFIAEDGSWELYARIVKVGEGKVIFRVLRDWMEPNANAEVPEGYRVEFISENGWRGIDPTGAVIVDKQPERGFALDVVLEHATATAPKRKKAAA